MSVQFQYKIYQFRYKMTENQEHCCAMSSCAGALADPDRRVGAAREKDLDALLEPIVCGMVEGRECELVLHVNVPRVSVQHQFKRQRQVEVGGAMERRATIAIALSPRGWS